MVLDRYVNKMSNERFYYCFTKLALVKKDTLAELLER